MRTAPDIGVDIHFGPDSIRHKYYPANDKCHAYGVLKIDDGGVTYANLYLEPAHIDKMIAELVALKQEMDPPPAWCPAVTILDDEETAYCDRDYGHPGSHHAPGPDEGSEVAWSDEMAEVAS